LNDKLDSWSPLVFVVDGDVSLTQLSLSFKPEIFVRHLYGGQWYTCFVCAP